MNPDIDSIAAHCSRLWETRAAAAAVLDEIAGFVAPDRRGFSSLPAEGEEGRGKIWDSAPEDAALTLAAALHGMLTNPAVDWLSMELVENFTPSAALPEWGRGPIPRRSGGAPLTGRPGMNPEGSSSPKEITGNEASFAEAAGKAMMAVFSDPATGFNNEVNAFYLDLVCLGWAVFLLEFRDGAGPRFRCVPPAQCAIAENADGLVDTVLRRYTATPAQLVEEFGGKDRSAAGGGLNRGVSEKTLAALEEGRQTPVSVSHLVIPAKKLPASASLTPSAASPEWGRGPIPRRSGATAGAVDSAAASSAFVSIYFETGTKHVLRLSRYNESPYMVPRWSKRSGEVYGRGPGHACLPDMRVLNRVALSQLIGGEKLADPPLVAAGDSVVGKLRTHAGGITYIDPAQCLGGNPAAALQQLPINYRLDVAEAILDKRREAIRAAFLNDRIQLAGGPRMTATEVIARERKQNLVLGPVLGRLENEFLGPLTERLFLLLLRNSRIAAPPSLAGRELRARYVSPISRSQRQGEAEAFARAMQYLAPAGQMAPEIFDNFDFNRAARDSRELFGFPADYLRPEEEVEALREQRAEQQQQQMQQEMQQQLAGMGQGDAGAAPRLTAAGLQAG